jgi:hypothetical protein
LDEAQSISRRGSETSELAREFYNAAIDRDASVMRCGGKRMDEVHEFPIYCPKALSLIGDLDGVLADRCLSIRLERKTKDQKVERCFIRDVKPIGNKLRHSIKHWAANNSERVREIYDELEPFVGIENDRLAELLMPLQAVLEVIAPGSLSELKAYAMAIDAAESERMSTGTMLLFACREIFSEQKDSFIGKEALLQKLFDRKEEPWGCWNNGQPMTTTALANVLRPFRILPCRQQFKFKGKNFSERGYDRKSFQEAWKRYLPMT